MPHGLIFEFALLTGMRPEEYLALQWADVDFERGTAQVRRALVRHKNSWSFEEPKTARSRRTVFLPTPLLKMLSAHKRQQCPCLSTIIETMKLEKGTHMASDTRVIKTKTGSLVAACKLLNLIRRRSESNRRIKVLQ
jgi:integrase